MGIGMVAVVARGHTRKFMESIPEETWIVGELVDGHKKVILK